MAFGGWSYRTAYFEDFDGKYYEVTIAVAENADGKIIYNIGKMKEEASPKVNGSRDVSANGLRGFASSRGSITENRKNVKRQYSVSAEQDKRIDLKTYAETQREKGPRATLPKKAQTYLKGVERNLTTRISNALGAPKFAQRGFLQDVSAAPATTVCPMSFQSTRPLRGATKGGKRHGAKAFISIHAPLAGRDSRRLRRPRRRPPFQSTRPLRGATRFLRGF